MNNKYYILTKFFYYKGTFNAPKDQPVCNDNQETITFDSKKDAEKYLCDLGIRNNYKGSTWTAEGQYFLEHGEYDRPEYQIRKVRTSK